jgi:hypothetical protein
LSELFRDILTVTVAVGLMADAQDIADPWGDKGEFSIPIRRFCCIPTVAVVAEAHTDPWGDDGEFSPHISCFATKLTVIVVAASFSDAQVATDAWSPDHGQF